MSVASEPFVSRYTLCGLPPEHRDSHHFTIHVELRSFRAARMERSWAVVYMGENLNRSGKWDWEPGNSSRTAAWNRRHRFTLDEALRLAKAALPKLICNGLTAAQVLEKFPLAPPETSEGEGAPECP